MGAVIPQRDALGLQLVAIAGREPASSYLEVRSKRVAGPGMRQTWIPVGELDRVAATA